EPATGVVGAEVRQRGVECGLVGDVHLAGPDSIAPQCTGKRRQAVGVAVGRADPPATRVEVLGTRATDATARTGDEDRLGGVHRESSWSRRRRSAPEYRIR